MNNAKLKAIEDSQTGIAKKVLSVVPIADQWRVRDIVMEIARCGSSPDPKIVEGCLHHLCDSGLVKQPKAGYFQRVAPKDEPEEKAAVRPLRSVATMPTPTKADDPLADLARTSADLRRLAKSMESVADAIDESALAMQERVERAVADNGKLRQLQQLLKDIGQ